MRWISLIMMVVVSVGLQTGCARKRPAPVCYEPPLEMLDLGVELPRPENGFILLEDARSAGRFACVLAIARVTLVENDVTWYPGIKPVRSEEQARWTEHFRGFDAIQHIIFLTPRNTLLEGQDPAGLCAAAERLGASLLLTYAPNVLGPNSAEVLGVLYETTTGRALATFHASELFVDEEGEEVSIKEEEEDLRDIDAEYQAQREFEDHVVATFRELIRADQPPPTTQPHNWKQPFVERWWLSYRRY